MISEMFLTFPPFICVFSCLPIRPHSLHSAVVHDDLIHGSVQQEGPSVLCIQPGTHTTRLRETTLVAEPNNGENEEKAPRAKSVTW